jgi:hypothetical protein
MWHDYLVLEYIWLLPILLGAVMAALLIAVPKITDILRRRRPEPLGTLTSHATVKPSQNHSAS